MSSEVLVILDVDGTLLHREYAAVVDHASKHSQAIRECASQNCLCQPVSTRTHLIYPRPGLVPFLNTLRRMPGVKLAIWSAMILKNLRPVLHALNSLMMDAGRDEEREAKSNAENVPLQTTMDTLGFEFIFDRSKCTPQPTADKPHAVFKDLRVVWRTFPKWKSHNTLLLDDTPSKASLHLDNLFCVNSFSHLTHCTTVDDDPLSLSRVLPSLTLRLTHMLNSAQTTEPVFSSACDAVPASSSACDSVSSPSSSAHIPPPVVHDHYPTDAEIVKLFSSPFVEPEVPCVVTSELPSAHLPVSIAAGINLPERFKDRVTGADNRDDNRGSIPFHAPPLSQPGKSQLPAETFHSPAPLSRPGTFHSPAPKAPSGARQISTPPTPPNLRSRPYSTSPFLRTSVSPLLQPGLSPSLQPSLRSSRPCAITSPSPPTITFESLRSKTPPSLRKPNITPRTHTPKHLLPPLDVGTDVTPVSHVDFSNAALPGPPFPGPALSRPSVRARFAPRPVAQLVARPVPQPIPPPVPQPNSQPDSQPIPAPVLQPVPQPDSQPVSQPISQPIPQLSFQPNLEPALQPILQLVLQPILQSALSQDIFKSGPETGSNVTDKVVDQRVHQPVSDCRAGDLILEPISQAEPVSEKVKPPILVCKGVADELLIQAQTDWLSKSVLQEGKVSVRQTQKRISQLKPRRISTQHAARADKGKSTLRRLGVGVSKRKIGYCLACCNKRQLRSASLASKQFPCFNICLNNAVN